jgi:hypothetical protein
LVNHYLVTDIPHTLLNNVSIPSHHSYRENPAQYPAQMRVVGFCASNIGVTAMPVGFGTKPKTSEKSAADKELALSG